MIFYENFVKLCCFYDFRPPVSNFMVFYDFMLTGTPTDLFGKTLKRKFFGFLIWMVLSFATERHFL